MRGVGDDERGSIRDLRDGIVRSPLPSLREFFTGSPIWATATLVGVNALVFALMAVKYDTVAGFSPLQLAVWGGNSGQLDLDGQWWRLITYQFLHANLLHFLVNMWVMWTVGRRTERFYGSVTLIVLYLATGALAGLTSIVWNPDPVSVGASGSIFGILAAFIVFLYRARHEVPTSILRYWLPALLFAGYSLYSGTFQPTIDNAAHVGGFIAGFVLGGIVARPLDNRVGIPVRPVLAAAAAFAVLAAGLLWYIGAFNRERSPAEEFAATHRWYTDQETANLQLWMNLAGQAAASSLSSDDLSARFSHDILPFWREAAERLGAEAKRPSPGQNPFVPLLADFARLRRDWAAAIIGAAENDPDQVQAALQYAEETNLAQARITRLNLRFAAEASPRPLAENPLTSWVSENLMGHAWECVNAPPQFSKRISPTDSPFDGPAQRHAAGCSAQKLFLARDYTSLDSLMKGAATHLADLPDGSSRLEGIVAGLDNLFEFGQIGVEDVLRRTAEWRQTIRASNEPDIVEALMFRDWAYAARGHGYASTVSPLALALYSARIEMAAAGLSETKRSGRQNPMWYQLSLGIGRDQSQPREKMTSIFDEGAARFPKYLGLYKQMLITLMPRWGGSVDDINSFILSAARKAGHGSVDSATYAYLYLIYGNYEQNDFNVIEAATADPALMKSGLQQLLKRYPGSDFILNAVARDACIDNDYFLYRSLRPRLNGHISATAWPDKLTVASCDKWANG